MPWLNENFQKLPAGYLFPEISRRVARFSKENPRADIVRMGIGDVTRPLTPTVLAALHQAVEEMGRAETFRGYGPEQGYDFLRQAIAEHDFQSRGIAIRPEEIFVSDGSKCDCGSLLDLFGPGNRIAIPDPVYPVYVDTNVMAGNAGRLLDNGHFEGVTYLPMTDENGFQPELPTHPVDVIYLCSPNNPTGAVLSRERMAAWVTFALQHKSVIIFDAAYEAYIRDPQLPHSIYEIEGAKHVAIELRSFSKTAGFTGLRCAYCVVPSELRGATRDGRSVPIHPLWLRRHTTKFNGVSYPVQRAAAAVYSPEGDLEIRQLIDYYMANAQRLRQGLQNCGFTVFGGENAPYIWLKTPPPMSSWEFFDRLLHDAHIVGTPGSGFGAAGEGYFRLSAFASQERTAEALHRLQQWAALV